MLSFDLGVWRFVFAATGGTIAPGAHLMTAFDSSPFGIFDVQDRKSAKP